MTNGAGPLEAGQVFAGRFRVERPLAEGGMGELYVVTNVATNHRCALKVLGAYGRIDEEIRSRFLAEAQNTPSTASDHIVKVLDAGVADGRPWITMELLDGATLQERVTRHGALSWTALRDIFEQLCHGLGSAHAIGVVHRDLKPENVFLQAAKSARGGDFVKVLDFGIAKVLDPRLGRGTASIAIGTQGWWAPEQVLGATISPATDVWALGLLAYWCLTERPFFDAGMPQSTMLKTATSRAAEQGVASRIPPGFDAWFEHCVAWEPTQRFRDAGAAWRALDAVLKRVSEAVAPTMLGAPVQAAPQYAASPTVLAQPAQVSWQAPTQHAPSQPPYAPTSPPQMPSLPSYGVTTPTPEARRQGSAWPWIVAVILSAIGGVALLTAVGTSRSNERAPTTQPTAPTPAPMTPPRPAPPDRLLSENPQLRMWVERWYATVTNATMSDPLSGQVISPEVLDSFYAPTSNFHGMAQPSFDRISRRWIDRRQSNHFSIHLESSTWLPQPQGTASRGCRQASGGEVLLLVLDAEEEGPTVVNGRAAPTCQRVAGPYLLSVRHDGADWRICNETWHLERALRASCPGAF